MRLACASLLLLAGCQSALHLESAPASRTVAPGGATSGGALEIRTHSGSIVGALIGLGVFATAVQGDATPGRATSPAMDPNRVVRAVDCTRPVEPAGGNLRCR